MRHYQIFSFGCSRTLCDHFLPSSYHSKATYELWMLDVSLPPAPDLRSVFPSPRNLTSCQQQFSSHSVKKLGSSRLKLKWSTNETTLRYAPLANQECWFVSVAQLRSEFRVQRVQKSKPNVVFHIGWCEFLCWRLGWIISLVCLLLLFVCRLCIPIYDMKFIFLMDWYGATFFFL